MLLEHMLRYLKVETLHLIAQKNLIFRRYNAQFTREYCYIYNLNMYLKDNVL
jgi:hypothetical protein